MSITKIYEDNLILDYVDCWLDCYYTGLIISVYASIFPCNPTTYLYNDGSYFRLSQEYMTPDGYTNT